MRIIKKKKEKAFGREALRKRFCRFCKDKVVVPDYKDLKNLEKFISERGKILSSRLSGNCARHQRILAQSIKQARFLAILSYTGK